MRNLILLFTGLLLMVVVKAQNPSVQFAADSQTVSEGSGSVQIGVMIDTPNANPTTVQVMVTGGNAVSGVNYNFSPATLTFPASSSAEQFFTVTILDDSIPDGNKTLIFGLSNTTNSADIDSPGQFVLTMQDDDTPTVSFTTLSAITAESAGSIQVSARLNRREHDTTKVNVVLVPAGTTAVDSVDFIFNDTMLVWPPDSTGPVSVSIGLIDNAFYEHDRTVQLGLYSPTNAALSTDSSIFTLDIKANSAYSAPSCSDLFFGQYVEGYNYDRAVQIYNPTDVTIDLGAYSIIVDYGDTDKTQLNLSGTIAPKGIYNVVNWNARGPLLAYANLATGFLNFDGSDAVALLHNTDTIDIIGQFTNDPGHGGWAVGNDACGGNVGTTHQQTLIRNYYIYAGDTSWARAALTWDVYRAELIDSLGFHNTDTCGGVKPVATVRFGSAYDSIPQVESTAYVVVEINNPTTDSTRITIVAEPSLSSAVDGYGYDYFYTNQTFNSPPGITYDSLPVLIFPRPEITPTKTIVFKFTRLSCNLFEIPDSIFTLYLTNNNKFVVSFLGAGYSYPKGSGLVEIPIVESTYSSQPTTVDVSLAPGSAVPGQDFLFNDTTVTFPAFSLDTQGVWVTILNNDLYEANKQANFNLSNVTNGADLGITGFTLTIINNDSLPGAITEAEIDNEVELFPNPVTNNLVIQTANGGLSGLKIRDVLGNKIMDLGVSTEEKRTVDVSLLQTGVYFLEIKEGTKSYCKRFVKVE